MNQQPDHLFRSKLEPYQLAAPSRAWNRIEAGLDKSSGKFWLKIAAGFAVLAVTTSLIWNTTLTQTDITQQNANVNATPEQSGNPQTLPESVINEKKGSPSIVATREKHPVKERNKNVKNVQPPVSEQPVEQIVAENATTETEIEETVPASTTGVFLVYSSEEVNEKYLMKKPDDEATPEAKKASRFQKIAGVAYNITTGDGLGDLREKKNEILALNFLDDKKGKEKKN